MDLLPPERSLTSEQTSDMASDLRDLGVSKDMEALLARGIHSAKLPKALRGQKAAEAFQTAFDIIGGVPRLALWADRNPDKFYPLVARMIPQTVAPVLAELPQTGQKAAFPTMPWLTARRLAYQESAETAADVSIKQVESD